jgi:hypothetical protein
MACSCTSRVWLIVAVSSGAADRGMTRAPTPPWPGRASASIHRVIRDWVKRVDAKGVL